MTAALPACLLLLLAAGLESTAQSCGGNGPPILFITMRDIQLINNTRGNPRSRPIIQNLTEAFAMDIHYAAKRICWSDQELEAILCTSYNGQEAGKKFEVVSKDLMSPDGLSCDWYTNKLYWTDGEMNRIEVASMDGRHRKVLYWTDIDEPRAIAVVPMKGLLFWTDWGETPKIERAGMNGDNATRQVIVSENIYWPNGLTVDLQNKLVFWTDGRLMMIEVVKFDGSDRRTILDHKKGLKYPFGITFHRNRLFWTDWNTRSVQTYDLDTRQSPRDCIQTSSGYPLNLLAWDPSLQPAGENPCQPDNGNCSHLCLLSPEPPGYTCACPIGVKMLDGRRCADRPEEMLAVALRSDICLIYLDSPDYTSRILPLTGVKFSIAVDFDPVDEYLYWSETDKIAIKRAKLNGEDQQDIIFHDIEYPDGLCIDWVARNLYWTDTWWDRIEVARLDGSYRKVLVYKKLVEPRAIAVAPMHGWMFWSDWNEKDPKIERANLDGTDRLLLVGDNLGWPNGITLDLERDKLYWCDAKKDKIEVANMDGTGRVELISENLPHLFGLSLMGDYIYWTDWQKRSVERAHKETGCNREIIIDQIANVMSVKAIKLGPVEGTNPCAENNGGCAQFCFNRPNNEFVCACQIEYELAPDKKSCVVPDAYLLYMRKDGIGRISVEMEYELENIPINGVKHASSIDFDLTNKRIYWSDPKQMVIFRAYMNGSDLQRVVEMGLSSIDSIAVDWVAHNIYWVDSVANKIEVARLDGSSRRTLLWKGLDEPKSLVLDPQEGYMYWSERKSRTIKRAAMDGSQQTTIVNSATQAHGLTIDYETKRLYWAEASSIQSSDLDGNHRQTFTSNLVKPSGLTLLGKYIYWIDSGKLFRALKTGGSNHVVVNTNLENVTDLIAVYDSKYSGANQCAAGNGGCSHLCLALPTGRHSQSDTCTCACPTHYTLNTTCKPPESFMMYSQRNLVVRFIPDSTDYPEAVLPIQGLKAVKHIDYDPVMRHFYWIDGKAQSIKRALDNGSYVIVVPGKSENQVFDLAVDPVGRLLYWTCTRQNSINASTLDNNSSSFAVLKSDNEMPRLIAVHATRRLLFWSDNGPGLELVGAQMNAADRFVISRGMNVSALAVDHRENLVVWAQIYEIKIYNLDTKETHSLHRSRELVVHLAAHSGFLYWGESQHLNRLRLRSAKSTSETLSNINSVGFLTDVVSVQLPGSHRCAQHQAPASGGGGSGGHRCSHICAGNATDAWCACPQGLALQADQRTCLALSDCGPDFFSCLVQPSNEKDCIPINWHCDGSKDCKDGRDEKDCQVCRDDQFRCRSGTCINKEHVCDGIEQCPDGFDEKDCCKSPNDFQCPHTSICLPSSMVCNGEQNCADGGDELNCPSERPDGFGSYVLVAVPALAGLLLLLVVGVVVYWYRRRSCAAEEALRDPAHDPLSPKGSSRVQMKAAAAAARQRAGAKTIPDLVNMSIMNGSETSSYDRRHITGASNSTHSVSYPKETLNPPPSPATTAASTRGSSQTSRYRPYRHYRFINQPPPPTPCSTDICDESDCNSSFLPGGRYVDGGHFPPPPTPRSHCHSESCPPSPGSRSSTYFSPVPPPPSPVP